MSCVPFPPSVSFLSFGPATTQSPGKWAVMNELAI